MAARWPIVLLGARRSRGRFMHGDRPASNSCSALALMRQVAAGQGQADAATGNARPGARRRRRPRHRHSRFGHRESIEQFVGDAVVLATGGYGNVFYLSTNAKSCNVTASWRCHKRGAFFANPCFTQIHPTCIPALGRASIEAHPDERKRCGTTLASGCRRRPKIHGLLKRFRTEDRDYFLERRYPAFGNLVPRTSLRGQPRSVATPDMGSDRPAIRCISTFQDAIARDGVATIRAKVR